MNEYRIYDHKKSNDTKKNRAKHPWLRSLSLMLAGAVAATGIGLSVRSALANEPAPEAARPAAVAAVIPPELNAGGTEIAETVENIVAGTAIDSIVGITVQVERDVPLNMGFGSGGFRHQIPQYVEGVGSGVILTSDGLIITNSHVVNGGDSKQLTVTLNDGTEYEGEVLWADSTLDLALVDVEAEDLQAIAVADSSELRVGDKVIAIGNPLGLDLQSTLTSGYVSGLDRSLTMEDGNVMEDLIQTDAAINSGNSGGALLNAAGELVAINTAKASQADGIGFAIPINTAYPIIERVIETGTYDQVALGITGITASSFRAMGGTGEELPSGVYIYTVSTGSAAEAAGLETGDVITAIDGHSVDTMNGVKRILAAYEIGDEVTLDFVRDGETQTAVLTFRETLSEAADASGATADERDENSSEPTEPQNDTQQGDGTLEDEAQDDEAFEQFMRDLYRYFKR